MGQELTNPSDNGTRLAARVGALYATIERDHHLRDTLPVPIDKETRVALDDYRRALHARLQPLSIADRQTAGKAIGSFLLGYLNAQSSNAQQTLASYLSTVADQPLFAILQAIDDFKNGRAFDIDPKDGSRIPFTLDYAPSAPRLLDQVKKCAGPVQEERHRVSRLLAITKTREPEILPAERERVGILMNDLAEKMKMGAAKEREADAGKIRAEAAAARARSKRIIQEAAARRAAEAHSG